MPDTLLEVKQYTDAWIVKMGREGRGLVRKKSKQTKKSGL